MAPLTDKEKKRLAEKHAKLLAELVKKPENSTCADCGAPGPRWASWNLGVFLCIRCGGFHRRIGTHITKVKSISLDNWTSEQIEHFRRIGNKRANAFFVAHPERHQPPRSDREIERYIRDKYERRLFVDPRSGIPDPTQDDAPQDPVVDEATALTRLRELGFTNVRDNHAALVKFKFDIDAAARHLGGAAKPKISGSDQRVNQLVAMGFDSTAQNIKALELSGGDVNKAIELLLSDNPPAPPAASAPAPPVPPKPADLLDDDLFASVSSAPAPAQTPDINDMLGSLLVSSAPAPTPAPAAPPAQAQNTDLFGDFGDFLSATPATAEPAASSAAVETPKPKPQSTGNANGGQAIFSSDFIMSLYSKASPATTSSQPNPSNEPQNGGTSNAFNDLDFFFK